MMKKFILVPAVALLLFVAACGSGTAEKGNAPTPPAEKPAAEESPAPEETAEPAPAEATETAGNSGSGVSVAGEDVQKGDTGVGPLILESRFGVLTIPAGVDYELYVLPKEDTDTATLHIRFGAGNTGAGAFIISTTRMVSSLETAVGECIRMNDYGVMTADIDEAVSYGGLTYQPVTFTSPDGKDIQYFLVAYYLTEDGQDGYVEMQANGQDNYYRMDIDDPAILEMLETLTVR